MTIQSFFTARWVRALTMLIIAVAMIHLMLCGLARHEVTVVERDIAKHGLPLRRNQVIPHASELDNAAHDYEKAFVLLSLDGSSIYGRDTQPNLSPCYAQICDAFDGRLWLEKRVAVRKDPQDPKDSMDPESWPVAVQGAAWATLNSPDFDRIRLLLIAAGKKPSCVFGLRWEDGPAMRLPMAGILRQTVSLLCAHALLSRQHGQQEAAMEDFEAALNVAVHTQQIPLLFFGELSLAEESKALRSIAIALSKSALGDTASIEAALSRIENRTIFATDFDTERVVIGGSVFGLDMPLPGMTLYQSTLLTPLRLHDYACYESKLEQASIDLKAGLPMSTMSMSSMPTMMLRVMLPDLSRLEGAIRKADKALATARMVFALERFHHLGLPYPQRLDDLVPTYVTAETLQDIQPFGYILTAGSWWLDTAESYDPKQPQLMLSPSRHDVWKSPMRPQQQ